jgi:anti-sigma factor (TIGR02949 family)
VAEHRHLTCEEVFRRLDDYLDRELDPGEVPQVERHLAECEMCAREYRFEGSVLAGVRKKVQRIQLPPGLLGRISRRLSQAREDTAQEE